MSEKSIQNAILVAVTKLPGSFFWRANSGVAPIEGRMVRFNLPGCPDILGTYRGRFVGIEVKTPTGRQSEAQRRFQAAVLRGGGVYVLARSVDDALTALVGIQ
jgi:hypothetical protein